MVPTASLLLLGALMLTTSTSSLAAGIKDAPRRTTPRESEAKTSTAGEDVKLTCPIDGTPMPIYEWSKDAELIPEEGWERMRLQGRTLRIKEVTTSDQGTYVCTAVNGFGKDTFTTHLTVIDPLSASSSSSSIPGGLPPEFTQLLPPVPGKVDKPVGHNIKLKCQVSGVPEPTVTWFKDGVELREGSLGGDSRLTRHYLHLMDLRPQDTGTYTCAAANPLGAAAANWTVRVIDQAMPREPEFYPQDPANTTVVAGEPATLQCRGNSEVTPHIKLVIPKVTVHDTGVYVCTATNNFGLAYRQARLSVLSETSNSNTLMLVVGLGCVAGVIVVAVVVVTVRRVQTTKPPPPPGPSESTLLPPPPINQAKMQPPPSHHARYVPQTALHSSQQGAPHGHAVGPEGPLLQYAGGVVHLPPQSAMAGGGQGPQPIIVYQDPATAASVYIAQRPPAPATSTGRPEYQYQHLDVI